jgi:hypothetical protein
MVAQVSNSPVSRSSGSRAADFARLVLRVDGLVSGVSGVAMIGGARPLGTFLGVNRPPALVVVGAGLLAYSAMLFVLARREELGRRALLVPVVLNVAWVLASAEVLLTGAFGLTIGGRWLVAVVADVVALFAVAQLHAWWRMR